MDEIGSGVLAAARAGWQLGVDIQTDRAIAELQQQIATLEVQRRQAVSNAHAIAAERDRAVEQNRTDREQIDHLKQREKQLLEQVEDLKARNTSTYNRYWDESQKKLELIAAAKSAIAEQKARVVEEHRKFRATFARLVGAEQTFRNLASEILDRAPGLDLAMLNNAARRRVLLNAWNESVRANEIPTPSNSFSFEPLNSIVNSSNGAG